MGLFEWANQKIKAQTVWDIGALKIFCTIAGMILGAYVSVFVKQNLLYFVVAGAVLFVYLMVRFFRVKA